MINTVRLNQLLAVACALTLGLGLALGLVLWAMPSSPTAAIQNFSAPQPTAPLAPKLSLARNIFDPTGQTWQAATRRATASGNNSEIKGFVAIPGLSGVLTSDQFVPTGSSLGAQQIETITGGRVVINGSQGRQEIDINPERQQRIEALPLHVE